MLRLMRRVLAARAQTALNTPEGDKAARDIVVKKAVPKAAAMNKAIDDLVAVQAKASSTSGLEAAAQYERPAPRMFLIRFEQSQPPPDGSSNRQGQNGVRDQDAGEEKKADTCAESDPSGDR